MLNYYSWWVGQKKMKLMLYSTLVEFEFEVGVELGNNDNNHGSLNLKECQINFY